MEYPQPEPLTAKTPEKAGYIVQSRTPLSFNDPDRVWSNDLVVSGVQLSMAIAFYGARSATEAAESPLYRKQVRMVERLWDYDPLTGLYTADDIELLPPAWTPSEDDELTRQHVIEQFGRTPESQE